MKEPPHTNIQIVYHDNDTNSDYVSVPVFSDSSSRILEFTGMNRSTSIFLRESCLLLSRTSESSLSRRRRLSTIGSRIVPALL